MYVHNKAILIISEHSDATKHVVCKSRKELCLIGQIRQSYLVILKAISKLVACICDSNTTTQTYKEDID